ncbi:MAG: GNAT family N-acetyltransferase, partial [Selenomonadaceae bacterium]|nr:GNAT family N-acetyltransferase [Selenomonadaceae bacterium]
DNERANKFYEKVGFSYEGKFIKHLYFQEEKELGGGGAFKNLNWYAMLRERFLILYAGYNFRDSDKNFDF